VTDLSVEFSLISAFNEVLHSVKQEVRAVGILADAEDAARTVSDESTISVLSMSDILSENDSSTDESSQPKGFLSWFRR